MSAPGSDVLDAVARARRELWELGERLFQRPEVRSVHCEADFLPSWGPHAIPLTILLEAVLSQGEPLVWAISVGWYDHWSIGAEVTYGVGDDIETVKRFAERRPESADGFVAELASAVNDLLSTVDEIDFADYSTRR